MNDPIALPLEKLIRAIALPRDEAQLHKPRISKMGACFAATRSSLWFFHRLPTVDCNLTFSAPRDKLISNYLLTN